MRNLKIIIIKTYLQNRSRLTDIENKLTVTQGEMGGVRDTLWRRQWHPTPVLLPGESHGWRSLVGCSPWGAEGWTWLSNFTFTFHFHALEKAMAAHSSVLAWRIPGTGEPGGLPSMGSHRVGHDCSDLAAAAAYLTVWHTHKRCISVKFLLLALC